jgi:acyl-CoA thioesterase I
MKSGLFRYGLAIMLCQGVIACGPSPDTAQKTPAQKTLAENTTTAPIGYDTLVVAFGDSLYAGYQLAPPEGLAPQLQAALNAKGIKARVHNAGVSGDTSAAGKARLGFVLDSLDRKPDLVLLGLGGNDMLRGIQPAQTRANLTDMMTELKKRQIKVVLTGMVAAPNMGSDFAKAFNPIYPTLAKQFNAPLYPFILDGVITDKALMLKDNVHPNAQGVAKVVANITPILGEALNRD